MTVRGTAGLAVLLALLASYLVATREPAPRPEGAPASLLGTTADAAQRLELSGGGRDEVLAERHADTWAPVQADDVIVALATLRPLDVVADAPADPAAYGFGSGATRLRVLGDTSVLLDLEIGTPNPAGTAVYVRRFGQPSVLLVGAVLRWEVEKLRRAVSATREP